MGHYSPCVRTSAKVHPLAQLFRLTLCLGKLASETDQ